VLSGEEAPVVRAEGEVLMPAVAVPVQSKQSFECPATHMADLIERLKRTTHVLIIGWRGMDRHFLALMREHMLMRPTIQIVCGEGTGGNPPATELASTLESFEIDAHYMPLGVGFSSYILGGLSAKFLAHAAKDSE
jgi:hypothetical protein